MSEEWNSLTFFFKTENWESAKTTWANPSRDRERIQRLSALQRQSVCGQDEVGSNRDAALFDWRETCAILQERGQS